MNDEILKHFNIKLPLLSKRDINNGIINTTELIVDSNNDKYIFQRINTNIFKNPSVMMNNIYLVTEHLKKKNIPTLDFIKADNGSLLYQDESGSYRISRYIENSISFDSKADTTSIRIAGSSFGAFISNLSDFDASRLEEMIPGFHNTPMRISHFESSVKSDTHNRVKESIEDIEYLLSLKALASEISSMNLPLRVTHNDTKTSNVLVDKYTFKPLAVIDLDTVMPGLLSHDFADSIRYSANYVSEDDINYTKAGLDIELFTAFSQGFIKECKNIITTKELDTLILGVITIVYEQAVRFLDDYLSGDLYYKCTYDTHNLVRARTQIGLLKDIIKKRELMEEIVRRIIKEGF